jgi:pimeloyl-ACP methyl ester carboxylesterase
MIQISKDSGYFKSADGTRIYYEVRGEGPPIILCYGIGCIMNHWQHQIKRFSKKYRVITFDYRAHQKSEIPLDREHLSIDYFAQDLNGLMEHLGLEKASVWGHSFGVQVLVRAYDMFPDKFEHMVFINGFAQNPMKGMFGNNIASSAFELFKNGYSMLPETLKYIWKLGVNNPIAIQLSALAGGFNLKLTHLKDIEIYARGLTTLDLDAFIRMFEAMMDYDGRAVLERIMVPTLIISGKKDSVTPQSHQEEMHKKIRSSQFLMVPYGSHCTQLDMPDFVNLAIEKFLSDHKYK